jgi:hypothetical protein
MHRVAISVLLLATLIPSLACAQDANRAEAIRSAMSAAPASVSDDATVRDWQKQELRAGTNEWTCMPDRPDTERNDPWCVNAPWLNLINALINRIEPTYTEVGFAYMLQGHSQFSNSDPYQKEPTTDDDWVSDLGGHLMMLIPGAAYLEGISTDHRNGGPWVMWPNTPYAHLMIPVASR